MIGFITQRFPLFIFGYFALQVLIRLATTNIAVLDESEQIMLSQYFDWGYNEQPPLYTWIQMAVFKLTGISIFGLSILKNTLLFLTYFFIYKLGILVMNDKLKSALGALSLFLLPQMVWDAQVDQTHTVFLTTATSLTVYLFFYILKRNNSWIYFVLFGLSAGVGLLAKYNFILVLIALGGVALLMKAYRERFFTRYLVLSIIIASVLVLPHFIWFITHLETATQRTVERMSSGHTSNGVMNFLKGNGDLVLSFIAFLSPFWLFFALLFKKQFQWQCNDETKAFLGYVGIIFAFLFLMVTLSGSTHVKERWLQPYLVLVPLFLFLHVKALTNSKNVRLFIAISLFAPLVVAFVVLIRPWLIDMRGKPTRASYPFEQLSHEIQSKLPSQEKVLIYAEDKYIGGNLKLFMPEATIITPSLPNQPYSLGEHVVVVWEREKPEAFKEVLMQKYQCDSQISKNYFHHSKALQYTVYYELCKLK